MRCLLSAASCVMAYTYLSLTAGAPVTAQRTSLPSRIRVQLIEHGTTATKEIALEDYVSAAAVSEFAPPAGEMPLIEKMLEIQAVIGRTYAVTHLGRHGREGFDLCSTTHCQLFEPGRLRTSRWAAAAIEAAIRTEGQVLRYGDQPAEALFHADCGGHTSSARDVWGGPNRDYLIARADRGIAEETHVRWEYRVGRGVLAKVLNADPRTRLEGSLTSIAVARRDPAGRAERVELRSPRIRKDVRGEDFREVLARAFGARAVRSTWFSVKNAGNDVAFAGRGFGHGVGLCQVGALARLAAGAKVKDVIAFYYPGTVVN